MKPHKKHQWQAHPTIGTEFEDFVVFVCHCGAYKQPKMYEVKP